MQLSTLSQKRWQRFKSMKRGYYSFILLCSLILFSLLAEILVNNRAILVSSEGKLYFPTYGDYLPGTTFGEDYSFETNYRKLQEKLAQDGVDGFVIMPPIPFNAFENDLDQEGYPPFPPDFARRHFLGTDVTGRDVAARIVYGFRIAIFFSLLLLVTTYSIGISVGSMMGYFGGKLDILGQRLIEIWSNIPFLYIVIIVSSIITPSFFILVAIMVAFTWPTMTWYMRTSAYKEKQRDYVTAARSLGCSSTQIVFKHILPNSVSTIITFVPFKIASSITALTALDYLGFGLPAPTPSWGELLHQGTENLSALWIVLSVIVALTLVLIMVTFIGEAIRDAFDPKKYSIYR